MASSTPHTQCVDENLKNVSIRLRAAVIRIELNQISKATNCDYARNVRANMLIEFDCDHQPSTTTQLTVNPIH